MQTNPQIEVEFSVINNDGTESDMTINLFTDASGNTSYANTRHSLDWKPLAIEASVIKTLGGTPDQASLILHNLPWIELFRRDPIAELAKFRDQSWRVRIWAWYDDNGTTEQGLRPNVPPVFVGDITDDFTVNSSDVTDASLQLQATGYGWLNNSGKMRKTWLAGTTYTQMFDDIFTFIKDKGYGREIRGAAPKSVINADPRMNKSLKRKYTVNRNPIEIMNDLTRDIDATWGIHNNIPYVIMRDSFFNMTTGDYPSNRPPTDEFMILNYESGTNSLIHYNRHTMSVQAKLSANMLIGTQVGIEESPQVEAVEFGNRITARFDQLAISLSNYGDGHQADCNLRYIYNGLNQNNERVTLPAQRADNSGLNNE